MIIIITFIIFFVLGFIGGFLYKTINMSYVDSLKNSLFTLMLLKMNKTDFEEDNYNYASYDGSKLPPLSGYSLLNASSTYMNNYNLPSKDIAINKYFKRMFNSTYQINAFINRTIEMLGLEN